MKKILRWQLPAGASAGRCLIGTLAATAFMNLRQLTTFNHIAIQCHDNPDADAIAAGFGLYTYFKSMGKGVTLFYGGRNAVSKPNLVKMLELLHIPLEHRSAPENWPGLLLTVDCQHGAGNVSPMTAREAAVIDHHIQEGPLPDLHDVRPYLGSCSTLVWSLLREMEFSPDTAVATALFYGLFTDTNGLTEVRHPLDRDLRDTVAVNERILRILRNCNLSLEDLSLASAALNGLRFHEAGRFALVGVPPCDPNILGLVSDLVIQVDAVDLAVVYSGVADGIKYSVRTVTREAKASDVAVWLSADGLGSGGGHAEKAGGHISAHKLAQRHPNLFPSAFFQHRLEEYLAAHDILDCHASNGDLPPVLPAGAALPEIFEKLPLRMSYVPCAEAFPQRSLLHIRMLEGDISLAADADTCLMIGVHGEVYPIARRKFEEFYSPLDGPLEMRFDYPPTVLDRDRGERILLETVARPCQAKGGGRIMALPLIRNLKLFTRWDPNNYVKGDPGDLLVWPEGDPTDLYIVKAAVFPKLYASAMSEGSVPDLTGKDLASAPGSLKVRKKAVVVLVRFAQKPGLAETREGPVPYETGDALITGATGEIWPVRPKHFQKNYAPLIQGKSADGEYVALSNEAWGLQAHEPFSVSLPEGAILRGRPGDWLMQYGPGEYGIVGAELFEDLYETIEHDRPARLK